MSGYIETFKIKEGDKDKNNKLMSFRIDDEKLLEKYKAIWTKIEDLKNIELNALPRDKSKKEKILLVGKSEKSEMTKKVGGIDGRCKSPNRMQGWLSRSFGFP